MTEMPNHRNVYISLATSMSKTGKFQLTPLVYGLKKLFNVAFLKILKSISFPKESSAAQFGNKKDEKTIKRFTCFFTLHERITLQVRTSR